MTTFGAADCALADAPVTLGVGRSPTVAVGSDGTAHFVWASRNGAGQLAIINYCRIPAGANACTAGRQFTLPLDFSEPWVFVRPADGAIVIADSRCCGSGPGNTDSYVMISTNGGNDFSAPVAVGSQFDGETDMALAPGGAFIDRVAGGTGYTTLQREALAGAQETRQINLNRNPDGSDPQYWYFGQVGYLNSGQLLVVMGDLTRLAFRVYGSGDLYTQTSWAPFGPGVIGEGSDASLAYGAGGLVLASLSTGTPSGRVEIRGYTQATGTWSPPFGVAGPGGHYPQVQEDASGKVHLVYSLSDGLYYSTSANGFVSPVHVFTDPAGGSVFHTHIGVNGSGSGWAVWDSNSSTGNSFAVRLPASTTGTGPGTGPGSGTLPGTAPCLDAPRSLCVSSSLTVGDSTLTLQSRAGCVRPNHKITVKFFIRKAKRKGHVVVKVGKVYFYVDRSLKKKVKHAPFRATITIKGFGPGTKHSIKAVAYLRSHDKRIRRRTLINKFTMCAR